VKIESPARIRDRTNGKLREHDVLITFKHGHHSYLTAIECRDRSRKITVNQIEGFYQKCLDTGINKSVMVSTKGFYVSALNKATHLGISCLNVKDISHFDWLVGDGFTQNSWKRLKTSIILIPAKKVEEKPKHFTVFDRDGDEYNIEHFNKNINYEIGKNQNLFVGNGIHSLKIRMLLDGFIMKDDETGISIPLAHANIHTEVEVTSEKVPYKKITYGDETTSGAVSEFALADIDAGKMSGQIVMSGSYNEGITIYYVGSVKEKT